MTNIEMINIDMENKDVGKDKLINQMKEERKKAIQERSSKCCLEILWGTCFIAGSILICVMIYSIINLFKNWDTFLETHRKPNPDKFLVFGFMSVVIFFVSFVMGLIFLTQYAILQYCRKISKRKALNDFNCQKTNKTLEELEKEYYDQLYNYSIKIIKICAIIIAILFGIFCMISVFFIKISPNQDQNTYIFPVIGIFCWGIFTIGGVVFIIVMIEKAWNKIVEWKVNRDVIREVNDMII